jgi:hypothetical protein
VAKVLEYNGQVAKVSGFANNMEALQDILIVKAALAYDDPNTGETFVFIIKQALYFGDHFNHILLNHNQICSYGVTVDAIPKHLSLSSSHAIIIKEENLTIPLSLNRIISYFNVRTTSIYEVDNCQHIVLTSK